MANLNLSEFGEKLFVADADHTFIWDTAASISKRVSRNSWLNSGTLTSDAPVTISQTWNNAAVAFTGLKFNATSTASAAGSLLLDLQVGGATKFSVRKDGSPTPGTQFIGYRLTGYTNYAIAQLSGYTAICNPANGVAFFADNVYSSGAAQFLSNNIGVSIGADQSYSWKDSAFADTGTTDTILRRDGAANTLALRNGANAQTFNVYGTYTSGTSYERLTLSAPSAANAIIGTNKGSGGGTARGLEFQTDGVSRWTISTDGHLIPFANNTYNIGVNGGLRPANVYVANAIITGGDLFANANLYVNSILSLSSLGPIKLADSSGSNFSRLQLGGTTNLFPAIKRSTVRIQAVLANDTGFTNIQGKLTTDTDYTATVVTPTGFLTLYDAQGTAYKVPCVPA